MGSVKCVRDCLVFFNSGRDRQWKFNDEDTLLSLFISINTGIDTQYAADWRLEKCKICDSQWDKEWCRFEDRVSFEVSEHDDSCMLEINFFPTSSETRD
ncbi:hypothetical protein RRG08_027942 [Elysia crispata]|uniref:Uncharacterized protein n=1 Tax=Elysia crispata TaxID=231223 RepID=A0AAE0Y7X1_9GAST|nr:hypothetical protein RRG08_027942 [Elysia crispata]